MYKLSRIAEITGSRFTGPSDHDVQAFMHDSRAIQPPDSTLFVALRSGRNNGHRFIADLVERGFRSFLIQKGGADPANYPEASFLVSDDPLKTLQDLAAFHRQQFKIPVIGITGSNGKTMVKEWLYQALNENYHICRSPKSYNSQIGVALSILNLRSFHTLAIFEAGISSPGEMANLEKMMKPTMCVFTSLGSAHDEGFRDREQKLSEKLLLFRNSRVNIFSEVNVPGRMLPGGRNVMIGGLNPDWIVEGDGRNIRLTSEAMTLQIETPFSDDASRQNAATCAVVLSELGMEEDVVIKKLAALQAIALRLEIRQAIHNSFVINDFYNSDLDSLHIALDYLERQDRRWRRIVVVSDIEQSGLSPDELYKEVGKLIAAHRIDLFVGIGERIEDYADLFDCEKMFFRDTLHFIDAFPPNAERFADATILLKGARSFGFEAIGRLLQQKSHDTVFEIDLNRLTANVNYYRSLVRSDVQMMCMVKAMGYGSGGPEIARTLQHLGVHYLAVAYADEGMELRQSMIRLPVMVMNPEEEGFDDIIMHQLEPELYSMRVLKAFSQKLDSMGIAEPFPVHIKIDSGMRRLGFSPEEMPDLLKELSTLRQLRVRSVFSHLAGSEDPAHDSFTRQQLHVFRNVCLQIENTLGYPVIKHICNSAAISRFPEAHLDMVRLGIGMYGVGSNREEQVALQNVGMLKTRISQIRRLQPGDTVGYSRRGIVSKETRTAVIPIGYADGFSRLLGNGAHGVYVHGKFCPTLGNICMDMCMIDVTAVECAEGDEVIIFSNYEELAALAKALKTIPYEVLTNVSARVKRVYVQE